MTTLLDAFNKANDDLARLLAEKKIITATSTRLQLQQIMHDLALTSFRVGHCAGSDLRSKQIAEICGSVLKETIERKGEGGNGKKEGV